MVVAQNLKEAEITEQDSLLLDSSPQKIMATGASNLDDLPDFIIQKVLTHLPIRDAARTSTLSKKWRNHWRNIPALVFDDSFTVPDSLFSGLSLSNYGNQRLSRLVGRKVIRARDTRGVKVQEQIYPLLHLSQVLLFHCGPIHKFTLSVPLESCYEIDNVMLFLCDKDVHEFTFDILEDHEMPSYLFAYQQLRHLDLGNCEFDEASLRFGGFPHLISLRFYRVAFTSIRCTTFISNCPLLERLTIAMCRHISSLEIDAPMLKSLLISGTVGSLFFTNTPLLSSVRIEYFIEFNASEELVIGFGNAAEGLLASKVIRFFECLPVVEYLRIEGLIFWLGVKLPTSPRLPITISHLKVLEVVCDFYREPDLSLVLTLIISSPNLQKLQLEGKSPRPAQEPDALNLLECEDLSDVTFQKLQDLRMLNFFGMSVDLEFVKFMLAKSVVLETLTFDGGQDCEKDISNAVAEFVRASPKVQIVICLL